ncbi:MAG: transporter substrate-binding domain-containing protein [Clostridia bacterium]|nr:transporter substrate-binding domain-containing protein [Clostridia bacterium]
MKKFLSLMLCVLMLVSAVAVTSCGPADTGADEPVVKAIDIPLTEEEYAFAVQKGDADLLASLNAFMAEINGNGKFEEIINKYFGDGTPTAVQSAAQMKTDGSQLIVATNAAFEPFEYMKGDQYYGVDMEIMALFADYLGKELYISNMEFDAVCLAVSALGGEYEGENGEMVTVEGGICDVAAAGLTVSNERREILDFSTSYYNAAQMIIAKEGDTTFADCKTVDDVVAVLNAMGKDVKVGVQNGTTGAKYCEGDADWGFDGYGFTTVGYMNGSLAVQDMLNGNINFVIIDEGPAKAIVARVNEAN